MAVSLFMSVVAVRVAEELECLQIWHDSKEHPFLTQSQKVPYPQPDCSGQNLYCWKYELCVITSLGGSWQRVREILVPREH